MVVLKRGVVLIIVLFIVTGVIGCMENGFFEEINDITEYLESKYGEKFIVTRLFMNDRGINQNKAYVHPEGREADWFAVRFSTDKINGKREFNDGYGFIFAAQAIFPEYEQWITRVVPEVKITIDVCNGMEVTRAEHMAGVSFDEFIKKEEPFGIDANIFVNEESLGNKEELFMNISKALFDVPNKDFFVECLVIFIKSDVFDSFDPSYYKGSGSRSLLENIGKSVAYTRVIIALDITQTGILEKMAINFVLIGE
jgi:hypothetical protein